VVVNLTSQYPYDGTAVKLTSSHAKVTSVTAQIVTITAEAKGSRASTTLTIMH
jgi:hypothetical protein